MSITNGELNNNNVEDVWNQQDNELDVKLSIKCNNSLKLKEKKWGNKKVRDKDCGESKWLMIKYKNNEEYDHREDHRSQNRDRVLSHRHILQPSMT